MDEITFGDVLIHYQHKLEETADQLTDLRSQLKAAQMTAEDCWEGQAGNACRDKLNELSMRLNRCESSISDSLVQLGAVAAVYEEPPEEVL